MGDLVEGDDGLPVEDVGAWAEDKHKLLRDYVQISSSTRAKYLGPNKGGSAYIDLFCGPGRCRVRESGSFIEGGCVAAWQQSVHSRKPFSHIIIGDADADRLAAAHERLRRLNAPVVALPANTAAVSASLALKAAPTYGLNFAFLDPYKLEALDFVIFQELSALRRIDFLVHISTMDLTRNYDLYMRRSPSPFDPFAPGWRDAIETSATQKRARIDVFDHWRSLVASVGAMPSDDVSLIRGNQGQRLYWLLLAAGHELAQEFWSRINRNDAQGKLEF
jgi:three-Cys-motif partner protein